jgi:hypothetical protein
LTLSSRERWTSKHWYTWNHRRIGGRHSQSGDERRLCRRGLVHMERYGMSENTNAGGSVSRT